MAGSDWGRHSKSCCKIPLGNLAVRTLWQISRGPATSSTTGVWNVLCHISRAAEEVSDECDIDHTRSIKTNTAVSLSRKPRLDLCCDLLQHLQGVLRTCRKKTNSCSVFTLSIVRWFCSVPSPIKLSFIWNVTRSNSRIIRMTVFAQFYLILFDV